MEYTQDIENLNTLLSPLGLKVNGVVKGSQSIRYVINLPIDLEIHKKIKRSESALKSAIPTAIGTTEYKYERDDKSILIEKKSDEFKIVKFENLIPGLPKKGLYLLLGTDDSGTPTYTNLRKAPHILVAGTTGSGKSELLHTFLASLVYRRKDNPCEIILIDPKRSEFSMYENKNGVYLITEMSEAVDILKDCCDKMDERYRLIQSHHCKDIAQLNDPSILPIVVFIDELKDLLMQDKRAEYYIVRLAQKARACGIHLILGTQTPRADVITGGIRANVPTKIAMHTVSPLESRIIIDVNGAEKLFGNGDMLYLGNGKLSLIRMQAAYVCNETKEAIANSIPYAQHTHTATPTDDAWERAVAWSKEYEQNHPTQKAPQKPKRVGLIRGIVNLMKVKPIMFRTDDYPPRI